MGENTPVFISYENNDYKIASELDRILKTLYRDKISIF
jgi:hypothetical protein